MTTLAPEAEAPAVHRLSEAVCPRQEPRYLERDFQRSSGELDCFQDVERYIAQHGGSAQYGWRIWIWPAVLIEAEFHAAWRAPDGHLVDISTPPDYANRVLFLVDPARAYEGKQLNNVRMPLDDNPDAARLIEIRDRVFEILNQGDLAYRHGLIDVEATPELLELVAEEERLNSRLTLRSERAMCRRVGRNDPCPCLSGLKSKKCCAGPRQQLPN